MDVVITGIAGRFPGAENCVEFFHNISNKKSSITEIPLNRWDWRKYYGDPEDSIGLTKCKWGGFVDDFECFDNDFFNISARESEFLDPQQRVLLELAWNCIEDSGHAPNEFRGKKVGIYIGVCHNDYKEIQERYHRAYEAYASIGTHPNMLANRISYFFDFHGPSFCVDTACSSSLFSLHQAVNAIRSGECDFALAGGINYLGTESRHLAFSKMGMLSPSGCCRTFDDGADGYVRGEGAGLVFIRKKEDAERDRDNIYAQIGGSGVNHGGNSRTITSPNVYGQSSLLVDTYTKHDIDISRVRHIECHGTATPLGDPIEINALKRAFKKISDITGKTIQNESCILGSVKTNIGHLEGAAGVAGLIKSCLMIKSNVVPELQNFEAVNHRLKLEATPFKLATDNVSLFDKNSSNDVYVGVSSFGFGGANAHVVLKKCSPERESIHQADENSWVIPFSAKSISSLLGSISAIKSFLSDAKRRNECSASLLTDIAYTLAVGREILDHRSAFVVKNCDDLLAQLAEFISGSRENAYRYVPKPQEEGDEFVVQRTMNPEQIANSWLTHNKFSWCDKWEESKGYRISLPGYSFEKRRFSIAPVKTDINIGIAENEGFDEMGDCAMVKVVLRELARSAKPEVISQNEKVTTDNHSDSGVDDNTLRQDVENWLCKKISEIIAKPVSGLDMDLSFQELGVDSVLGVDLIRSINKEYGLYLKTTSLYDYTSPNLLIGLINESGIDSGNEAKLSVSQTDPLPTKTRQVALERPVSLKVSEASEHRSSQIYSEDIHSTCSEILKEVLDFRGKDIPPNEEFSKLGIDSVTGVEFAKKIRQAFEVEYEVRHIYDYPNLRLTVDYLRSLEKREFQVLDNSPSYASIDDILQSFENDSLTLEDTLAALSSKVEG